MLTAAARMWKRKGVSEFFDGWSAYMAGSFQPAIQFTLYNQVRRYLLLRSGLAELGGTMAFVLGGLSRAFSEVLTYPTLVVQYIQQTADHPDKHKGLLGVAKGVVQRQSKPIQKRSESIQKGDLSQICFLFPGEGLAGLCEYSTVHVRKHPLIVHGCL